MTKLEFINKYAELYIKILKKNMSQTVHIDVHFGTVYAENRVILSYITGNSLDSNLYVSFVMNETTYRITDMNMEDDKDVLERVLELMEKELEGEDV